MKIYLLALNRQPFNSLSLHQDWQKKCDTNGNSIIYFRKFNDIIICITYCPIQFTPQDLLKYLEVNQATIVIICRHSSDLNNRDWENIEDKIELSTKPIDNCKFVKDLVDKSFNGKINWTRNLDPLIVIFTHTEHNEWWKALESNKATFYDDNLKVLKPIIDADKEKIRIAEFNVDNNYTVLFVKENNYGADEGGINDLLSQILNQEQWKNFPKEDIYVAVHALYDYAKDGDVDGFKKEFKDQVNYICNFHHTDDEPLYKQFCGNEGALIKFFDELNKSDGSNKAEELCNDLIKLIIKISGKDIRDISILKHQIINYLEPLRVDIDGLIDKNFENKYWDEVSKYWTGEKVEEIFKNINRVIYDFLAKKNSKKEIKDFVENIKHRINEIEDLFRVSELLNALKNNDKKTAQSICNLHGNIYKKWMDGLINEFEKMKSNLE